MARAVGSGAVLACEPNPNAAARLRANLELNALRNVTVAEVAVSDSSGQAPLFVPTAFEALASLQGERLGPAGVGTVSVPTATLDQLVAETGIRDVDVLKIDAEGVEGAVLQGSETTIARDQPVIFFECLRSRWEVAGHELEATLEWLRTLGYVTFMCVGYGGLHSLEHLETWGRDVVAFPQRRAD
jgi:FkbM family methyltransferase